MLIFSLRRKLLVYSLGRRRSLTTPSELSRKSGSGAVDSRRGSKPNTLTVHPVEDLTGNIDNSEAGKKDRPLVVPGSNDGRSSRSATKLGIVEVDGCDVQQTTRISLRYAAQLLGFLSPYINRKYIQG